MPRKPKLDAQTLVYAYAQGYFPMFNPDQGTLGWYSADPRGVIFLDRFHCPASLARRARSGRFKVTRDVCFRRVMTECAGAPRRDQKTWISAEMIDAYTSLHNAGLAHSVEAWLPVDSPLPVHDIGTSHVQPLAGHPAQAYRLVAGLYGVHLGSIFFGESMFHRATDGSRVCLVHLVEHLRRQGFSLLEIQAVNEHTAQFGSESIPAAQYLQLLEQGLKTQAGW